MAEKQSELAPLRRNKSPFVLLHSMGGVLAFAELHEIRLASEGGSSAIYEMRSANAELDRGRKHAKGHGKYISLTLPEPH